MTQNDQEAKDTISSKNIMKERLSKCNKKLVGKMILKYARHALWDQLALKVIKFRTYLEFVQEEFETRNTSIQKCDFVDQELTHRLIKVAQGMIDFISSASKLGFQVLKVEYSKAMITMEGKVIYKHRYA